AIKKLEKYDNVREMMSHHGKTKLGVLVALRLIPSVPMNMVSKAYGGMKFPLDGFVVASLLGFFPKIWVYSVMGGNISQPFTWKFMGPIIFLLILSGVATLIVNFALEERKGDNKNVKDSDA
ncbi:MAG: TVP38/TMEM64 family protein, partial [Clostridia bacterium]|nr:TVP38/TMEM64 family protein [Clostridia bacterium]